MTLVIITDLPRSLWQVMCRTIRNRVATANAGYRKVYFHFTGSVLSQHVLYVPLALSAATKQ